MTVSHRQKRWKRAMSKDGHMDAHIVALCPVAKRVVGTLTKAV